MPTIETQVSPPGSPTASPAPNNNSHAHNSDSLSDSIPHQQRGTQDDIVEDHHSSNHSQSHQNTFITSQGTNAENAPTNTTTTTDLSTYHSNPHINPLELFHWMPRSQYLTSEQASLDSIVSHKEHLLNIQQQAFQMNQNKDQMPQIVISNHELQMGKCYYWELKITIQDEDTDAEHDEIFGDLVEIGVLNMKRNQWDKDNISDQEFGWVLCLDGVIAHNDEETQFLKNPLKSGDRIGMLCNLKYDSPGCLSFFVNGVSQGTAYTNITGPVNAAVSLVQPGVKVELVRFEERI